MAGRRNRHRRGRAKAAAAAGPAVDSPNKSSSLSSSPGSTDRTAQRKIPRSRLHPLPEEEQQHHHHQHDDGDEDWAQSYRRAMRRDLLKLIHRYYLDAISRLPPAEFRTTLAHGLLVGGHCFGPLHPVHNIIVNSIWYAAAFRLRSRPVDDDEVHALLCTDGIVSICHRSIQGLVASLRRYCPSLSIGDALWQLTYADADLTSAVALANGTTKSGALLLMASQDRAAFRLAAKAARHPNPKSFAHFASSVLPTVNSRDSLVAFLLINHVLSPRDINHLSSVLAPALPYAPPRLSLRVLDRISSQKQQLKDTAKQVLNVVKMASHHYTLQTGEDLILHSVCGVSLLNEQGLDNCYHINFLAYRKGSGCAVDVPVLLFTEAIVLDRDESDIHLCVLVDPVTDIGCCSACETSKKIVHPTYDEYLGCRDFEEDGEDCRSNFLDPLDVDYILFLC